MSLYRDKKVLVVDDFPEFRMSIRQMLLSIKVTDIHMANTGEEALRMCQRAKFDIVLCDYNLGDGKDGQQLLEELREYSLLPHTSIFMMLTAENTAFMVMGALENNPDAYLTKPFTRQDLKARLDRLCSIKDELERVNYAMDAKDHETTLRSCDELITAKSKMSSHALKIKANTLIKMGRKQDAESIYRLVMKARPVVWAEMGLAKVLHEKEEFEQSIDLLESIVKKNDNYLDAFDLMAENYVAMGDTRKAQQILTKAISKSAKSPQRQHKLGQVARDNNDIDTATRALRRTVELSQNGLYQNPTNVLDYVEALKDKASIDESLAAKRAGADALNALEKYKKDIRKDPNTNVYSKILESKILKVQKKELDAVRAARDAKKMQEELASDVGADVVAELAETMLECGEFEDAAMLLNQLTSMNLDDAKNAEKVQKSIDAMMSNTELKEFHNSLNVNNQRGVELYDEGILDKAIDEFRLALEGAEDSITINLNLAQALIKNIQLTNDLNADVLDEAKACFDRVGNIERENPRYSRYCDLNKLYQGYLSKVAGG